MLLENFDLASTVASSAGFALMSGRFRYPLSQRLLACRAARGWPQAEAQAWWADHRGLVEQRIRERSTSVSESIVVEAPDETP